ncbi:MAG: MFS transporter [Candidatus Pacearchaeota archaeon]
MQERFNEKKEIEKALNYSTKDGIAATVAGGSGDNFVSAYAVSLGATNFQLGLLSALPTLIPVELFTPKAMEKFSRKKIVLVGVLIQILMYIMIAGIGLLLFKSPTIAVTLLIALFTIHCSTGLFISPAWNSWMKDLTEKIHIGKYFGARNKIFGITSIITIILAGLILDKFKEAGYVFLGFTTLFLIAAMGRTISRHYLKKQYEPKLKLKKDYYFSFWEFIKKTPTNNYGRFALFIALLIFSVNIAAPFFTPYMLKVLKFDYFTFTLINLVISGTANLLTMPLWGKFIDKYGCVRTMAVTVWAIPFVPLLWVISPSVYWLALVQVISGIVWAGFNLASGTFTYVAVSKERMNLCIAYISILNGFAVFLGATIGGILASLNITFMNIFLFVFIVSGIARILVIAPLFSQIKEVKPVKPAKPILKIIWKPIKEFLASSLTIIHYNHAYKKRFKPLVNTSQNKNSRSFRNNSR